MRLALLALFACALAACTPPTMASLPWDDECNMAEEAQARIEACTRIIETEAVANAAKSDAHLSRALSHEELEQHDQAAADYAAAIALAPENANVYIARASSHERAKRYDAALVDIAEALRLDPDNAAYLNNACWVRGVVNRELEQAATYCERAIAEARTDPNIWDSFALVRLRQGRFTDAYHHYDVAVRSNGEYAHYLYGRGLAALRIGKEAEGRADIAAALALDDTIDETYAEYGLTP